jgi:ribonuclease P protein component
VKRRLREIFRKNKEKILTGADVVLIAKPGIQNCTSGELEKIFLFEILKNHVRLP